MIDLDPSVAAILTQGFHIPPKPETLIRLKDISHSEDPSLTDVARVVASDVGLSSAILKTVNSPFYGLARSISNIQQAVSLLGMESVNSLATSVELKRALTGDACISLERFWDNATDVANSMVYIGNRLEGNFSPETLYTAGLFHDCGIPAMAIRFGSYRQTLIDANDSMEQNLTDIEDEKYDTNHSIVGYFIANSWHLPKTLCELILQHHEHDFLDHITGKSDQLVYAILKMAENIVDRTRRFREAQGWQKIQNRVLSTIGISVLEYSDIEEDLSELLK
ncbi:HDOD domain-containing protein [Sedimenticola sp.]|uniref:HDOD domain-containing protein n=1 Tax=Sedimenticola sp. TaxID=1940285 RepID=UPI003D09F23B